MKGILGISSVAVLCFCHDAVAGIDDGPHAYQLVAEGTNAITVFGLSQKGTQSFAPGTVLRGGNIDIDVGLVQYTHSMNIAGNIGALFAGTPRRKR